MVTFRIELAERLDGERHAAEHALGARDEPAARVPVGDDRRDRGEVVERVVLVERGRTSCAQLVLTDTESEAIPSLRAQPACSAA